jgi:hypothetical protein
MLWDTMSQCFSLSPSFCVCLSGSEHSCTFNRQLPAIYHHHSVPHRILCLKTVTVQPESLCALTSYALSDSFDVQRPPSLCFE